MATNLVLAEGFEINFVFHVLQCKQVLYLVIDKPSGILWFDLIWTYFYCNIKQLGLEFFIWKRLLYIEEIYYHNNFFSRVKKSLLITKSLFITYDIFRLYLTMNSCVCYIIIFMGFAVHYFNFLSCSHGTNQKLSRDYLPY